MDLTERARLDAQFITTNPNDFGIDITVTTAASINPLVTGTVRGLHTKHHMSFDTDGVMVNSKTASVAISEKALTDAGFPVRDSEQEVSMLDYLISTKDSSGILKNYIVRSSYPDENLGLIVLILGDYSN